ncbi:hypothetical protein KEJ18_04150 [Candidatus Bathyarchaeota archaeon]|nr:hypothetical protein [Candidatus Bathyarchaeota archaeon]
MADLKKACYERVPKHWSYGAELQNRRLRDLIHKLENRKTGKNRDSERISGFSSRNSQSLRDIFCRDGTAEANKP